MYDYYLGGKDHFAADRETADKVLASCRRAALRRARIARSWAGRSGSWLPRRASGSSSTSAPACRPRTTCTRSRRRSRRPSRVVYADNDPLVLAHARALLTSSPEGRTAYIQADLRDPQSILSDPAVREVLDFGQPVALMLVAILHFVPDEFKPAQVIAHPDRRPAVGQLPRRIAHHRRTRPGRAGHRGARLPGGRAAGAAA